MRDTKAVWRERGVALLPVAALGVYVALCTNPHYDLNDDVILLRSFGGMVGGVYEAINPFVHTLLAWPVHWLSRLFPLVAWYSVLQISLLALGLYAVSLGVIRTARTATGSLTAAGVLAALAVAALGGVAASSIVFTTTAAVLSAGAVWRLLSTADSMRGGQRADAGVLSSFGLLLLACGLRKDALLPSLAFWLGGVMCLWLIRRVPLAALLRRLGICALALLAAWGVRAADVRIHGEQTYLRWIASSVNAIDYGGLNTADDALLDRIGWTESQRQLALDWCFLDADMTAEAFEAIPPDTSGRTATGALTTFQHRLARSAEARAAVKALVGLCALAGALALLGRRGERLWPFLAALCCSLCAGAMLGFLAWRGRLPARAVMTVTMPAGSLALWLALHGAAGLRREASCPRAWAGIVGAWLCAALLLPGVGAAYRATYNPSRSHMEAACTRLERYALAHPDEMLIAALSFQYDRALFPDWRAGKPDNLLLFWGGWNNHSEGYRELFSAFGYQHDDFRIADFADGPVRLVTAPGEEPPDELMTCMREQAGKAVQAVLQAREDGFWVYRFTTENK